MVESRRNPRFCPGFVLSLGRSKQPKNVVIELSNQPWWGCSSNIRAPLGSKSTDESSWPHFWVPNVVSKRVRSWVAKYEHVSQIFTAMSKWIKLNNSKSQSFCWPSPDLDSEQAVVVTRFRSAHKNAWEHVNWLSNMYSEPATTTQGMDRMDVDVVLGYLPLSGLGDGVEPLILRNRSKLVNKETHTRCKFLRYLSPYSFSSLYWRFQTWCCSKKFETKPYTVFSE